MRSIGLASVTALILIAAVAAPVSANPPTKEPTPNGASDFDAGVVCDFPVRLDYPVFKAKLITFDRKDGQFRQNLSGHAVATVTNLATGASATRNSSGPGKVAINAAGHAVISINGGSVLAFFDGDAIGRGLLYLKGGGGELEIGDDGFYFVRVDLPQHVEDLCATLG